MTIASQAGHGVNISCLLLKKQANGNFKGIELGRVASIK